MDEMDGMDEEAGSRPVFVHPVHFVHNVHSPAMRDKVAIPASS